MFADYRHDVCQVQKKKKKKFTVVLGLKKNRVATT